MNRFVVFKVVEIFAASDGAIVLEIVQNSACMTVECIKPAIVREIGRITMSQMPLAHVMRRITVFPQDFRQQLFFEI